MRDRIEPLRTRERAAVEAARAALRKIALDRVFLSEADDLREIAGMALVRIAVILGERT